MSGLNLERQKVDSCEEAETEKVEIETLQSA